MKVPFIQVASLRQTILEWTATSTSCPRGTSAHPRGYLARWRITDPLLFYQRLRDERSAQSRLDDILDGETRNAIANHDRELVRAPTILEESDLPWDRVCEMILTAASTFADAKKP
jgi:membrane protease subunit HflC